MSIAPDAVGAMPGLGGPGMPDPSGAPPMPQDPNSMAALAAILQGGGAPPGGGMPPGGPPGGGLPPGIDPAALLGGAPPGGDPAALLGGGGGPTPGGPPGSGDANTDLLTGMDSTDHIRAAIKHLMMAMTESGDDEESHGITKGMAALHGILAGKAKNQKTVAAAGG
jgi:hypothetical protein